MPGKHSAPDMPRKKKGKKIVAITLVCALVLGGAGVGGYQYLHNRTGKDVNVYPVNQLGSSDSWYDRVNTGGQVRADRMQAVYLSSTQTVTEIFVEEGQQVKVGDPILAFDTTLDEVELTRKQIAIDQLNLDLENAREKLQEIDTYKVGSPGGGYSAPRTPAPTATPEPTDIPYYQRGEGTEEDPYVFLWGEGRAMSDATVEQLLTLVPTPTPTPTPSDSPDPDASASPEASSDPEASSSPEASAGGVSAPAQAPAGGVLTPVSADQWTAGGLIAMARMGGSTDTTVLDEDAEPTETPTPTGTPSPTPTEETAATDTPSPTPTENTENTSEPSPTPIPYEDMDGEAILDLFRALREQPEDMKALYDGLTEEQKRTVVEKLDEGQLAELLTLLTEAGVEKPTFPLPAAPTEVPAAPTEKPAAPDEAPPPANGGGGGGTQVIAEPSPSASQDPEPDPSPTEGPEGVSYYMVFEVRTNDSMQGDILWVFEIKFTLCTREPLPDYWSFTVMEPAYMPQINWEPPADGGGGGYFNAGNYYTAAEIEQMRSQTNQEIRDLTLQLKMAEQELKKVQYELSNGEVLCTTDGVVKSVLDPTEALETEQPVVMVSGGGGYFVDAYLSEFDMQYMHVGDKVTVENYMAGEELEGTITEISQYPTTERYVDYSAGSANENSSKYPFTVAIAESDNLREYYYVNVYFSSAGQPGQEQDETDSFYLDNAFIRTEGSRSYVYVAGEDGLLEKRYVSTGKSMGSYSTEITGGLDIETDYIAFPYGRSVKAGAKAIYKEDVSALWNGY